MNRMLDCKCVDTHNFMQTTCWVLKSNMPSLPEFPGESIEAVHRLSRLHSCIDSATDHNIFPIFPTLSSPGYHANVGEELVPTAIRRGRFFASMLTPRSTNFGLPSESKGSAGSCVATLRGSCVGGATLVAAATLAAKALRYGEARD